MTRQRATGHTVVAVAAAVLAGVLVSTGAPRAQRGGGGGSSLIPATAASVLRDPEPFLGRTVSLMAAVEQRVSPTAFTVDQDKARSSGEALLVIVPTLQEGLELNSYVTVQGPIVRFDPEAVAQLARGYTLDLPADFVAAYGDKPVVVATAVITSDLTDLAKVPPPPITPEEEAFDAVMKQVSAANGALRGGLQAKNAEQVKEPLSALKTAFSEAEAFFTSRGTADAVELAQQARSFAEAIEKAVADGDWDAATTASASLAQQCSACHGAHRVQLEDGTYRVKWDGSGD